jgi:hypothetical protein
MPPFYIRKSIVIVAILQHTDNTLYVDSTKLVYKGLYILILYSLGSFTGLYSFILNSLDGLLDILLVLGLFNVSNLYKFAI